MMITISQQIRCIERELAMRRQVYANRVSLGKMHWQEAENEIALMQAVLVTLKSLDRSSTVQQGLFK